MENEHSHPSPNQTRELSYGGHVRVRFCERQTLV